MDKIERIRQEIERLKKYAEESKKEWINEGYTQNAFAEDCRITSFDKLLSFIDTLSEEPDKDLEEAARLYAIPHYMKDIDVNHIEEYPYDTGLEAAFIAGAKWDAEHLKK